MNKMCITLQSTKNGFCELVPSWDAYCRNEPHSPCV